MFNFNKEKNAVRNFLIKKNSETFDEKVPVVPNTDNEIIIAFSINRVIDDQLRNKVFDEFWTNFKKLKLSHTINNKYLGDEVHTELSITVKTTDYVTLGLVISLILYRHQYLYDMKINNEPISPFIDFTALYLNLLKSETENNYIVYNTKSEINNVKIERIIEYADGKYIAYKKYYNLYRDDYLFNDNDDYDEDISEDEIIEELFYNLSDISMCHK